MFSMQCKFCTASWTGENSAAVRKNVAEHVEKYHAGDPDPDSPVMKWTIFDLKFLEGIRISRD